MDGVRVSGIPKKTEEKHIKIHFSKPQNGGGTIKKIYYPLLNNDAVIIFHDSTVVESLLQNERAGLLGRDRHHILIQRLPEHTVFSSMQARVNPDASVLLQASPALLDEFKYNEEIDINFDEGPGTYVLSGNWYQLEWAWTYLDTFLQQQEVIQDEIKHQPFRNIASPLDVEDGGGGDVGIASRGAAASEQERFDARDKTKSAFFTENVDTDRKASGRMSVAQSLSRSSVRQEETTRKNTTSQDRDRSFTHQGLTGRYEGIGSPAGSENENEDEDRSDLTGRGYKIPDDSIPMSMNRGLDRRADQDSTFDQFSGLNLEVNRHSERKDNRVDIDMHQKLGMSRSGKHTDNKDKQDIWLSDSKRMSGFSGKGADIKNKTIDTIDDFDRFQIGRKDSTERQRPSKADARDRQRETDSSPDREESSYRGNPSKGYQSLPVQGYDRGRESSSATHSGTRSGAVGSKDRSLVPFGETYTKDHMQYQFTVGGIDVLILYGDLVQETTDAIVNPANSGLEHWGGASYAISRAAGPALDKECRDFIAKNGQLKVADVMHTTGGNLQASHVLHTYGPIWYDSGRKDKTEYDLISTFLNCFNYTENLSLGSLCVPAISTGVFGVPLDICVRSFLDALLIFDNQRTSNNLKEIHFINRDTDATVTAIVLLQTALEADMGTLLSQALEKFNRFQTKELDLPKGRSERTIDYGLGMDTASSFTKSLYHGTSLGASIDTRSKTPPRRSSSLSRISKTTSTDSLKEGSSKTMLGLKTSTEFSTSTANTKPRSDSATGETKTHTTDTNTADILSKLSKYTSSASSPKSDKDVMSRTTPSLKPSLLSPSGTTDIKMMGIRKQSGSSSPSGKVRAKRDIDDDLGENIDTGTSGVSRISPKPSTARNRNDAGLHSLPADLSRLGGASKSPKTGEVEKCLICLDTCIRPKTLEICNHVFCTRCIDEYFKKSKPSCPICGTIYGKLRGTQPRDGSMTCRVKHSVYLPGYERAEGTIVIKYMFPSGLQKDYHPNPGKPYKGIQRTAYLPNNHEGKLVLGLLKKAFEARLVFTIGDSCTTGKEGVLTWNDIHHKTNIYGGTENFGYPDPSYLTRVKQELADKGITSMY